MKRKKGRSEGLVSSEKKKVKKRLGPIKKKGKRKGRAGGLSKGGETTVAFMDGGPSQQTGRSIVKGPLPKKKAFAGEDFSEGGKSYLPGKGMPL